MEKLKSGLYRHYKGSEYEVLDIARHSETEEWHVVYKPCYGEAELWIRPLNMFTENVTLGDGSVVKRFAYIGNN
jgi:hypothetical protein